MTNVHMCYAGAPDKIITKLNTGRYIKHNNMSLCNFGVSWIKDKISKHEYILPVSDDELLFLIKHNDKFNDKQKEFILAPKLDNGNFISEEFLHKNNDFYLNLDKYTEISYAKILAEYTPEEFKKKYIDNTESKDSFDIYQNIVVKTSYGTGSRGIVISDTSMLEYPEYKQCLEKSDLVRIYNYSISNMDKTNVKILIQELIPNTHNLDKFSCDLIIKDGDLLTYKYEIAQPGKNFTNWDWATIKRTEYSDRIVFQLLDYLVDTIRLKDGIINLEGFTNEKDIMYVAEFNWRYNNSIFETRALTDNHGMPLDMISMYLTNEKYLIPMNSIFDLCRAWTPVIVSDKYSENIDITGIDYPTILLFK